MKLTREVKIGQVKIGGENPLCLIAGPCVIESEELCRIVAKELIKITEKLSLPFVFKASFDKANRSSLSSFRGPGIKDGLNILSKIKQELKIPILTDVHESHQAERVAEVASCLQIPALLSRQTDLISACAKTGKPINIKKGQFMAPEDMTNVVEKITSCGNEEILLTERGTSFGYHNLIVDFRSLVIMRESGYPVVFDATHSVQLPGGGGKHSLGKSEFVAPLARAAVGVGCEAIFMEVHPEPEKALCDGPNMVALSEVEGILKELKEINKIRRLS